MKKTKSVVLLLLAALPLASCDNDDKDANQDDWQSGNYVAAHPRPVIYPWWMYHSYSNFGFEQHAPFANSGIVASPAMRGVTEIHYGAPTVSHISRGGFGSTGHFFSSAAA